MPATSASMIWLLLLVASATDDSCFAGDGSSSSCSAEASYLLQADVRGHKARESSRHSHELKSQVGSGMSNPTVDDVMAAFNAMSTESAAINIDKGSSWPSIYESYMLPYTHHIEGIQRFRPNPAGGSTYLAFSGSGQAANIFIAEIPSRLSGPGPITGKDQPTLTGSITKVLDIDTVYTHAGGFQIEGDLLAIGVEEGCSAMSRMIPAGFPGACRQASKVFFYNVSDPLNPIKFSDYIDRPQTSAGAVGVLRHNGKWLVIVGDGNSDDLTLYDYADGIFHQSGYWSKAELVQAVGVRGGYKPYQTLNLILQSDGQIYMVGTTRDPTMVGHDYFDLFTIQPADGGRATITLVASKPVTSHGADFSAAGAIYVDSPTSITGYGSSWLPGTGTFNPVMPGNTIHVNEFV
eukprot:TRINITY_DN22921_c0_g1_i1.p1 TRINITY_DN22921_c0_g1~~TRINITY_DN22921_c0_g1_i1.p1  ORF type:complete len:407 (-),score=55.56 TRINITY_DN22921_c0_g1_i1:447-1667(-)